MRLYLGIFLSLLFWLFACQSQPKNLVNNFADLWFRPLRLLNQQSANKNFLYDDLNKIFAQESELIKNEWRNSRKNSLQKEFYFEKIKALNENTLKPFSRNIKFDFASHPKANFYRQIIESINQNPITSIHSVYGYQYGDQIGFCYARAMYAHWLLLKSGIAQDKIFKIFALGNFRWGATIWHFHVAVLVQDDELGFLVIDPLNQDIAQINDWTLMVARLEINSPWPRARFFITDPRKFMPQSGPYNLDQIKLAPIENYFFLLGQDLAKKS